MDFFIIFVIAGFLSEAQANELPSSDRSRSVIERVKPLLEASLHAKGFRFGDPIFIRIFKETKELELWIEADGTFRLFKNYAICAFSGDLGPKVQTGDRQSPEGFYFVTAGRLNPSSQYHLSFNLGYPNAFDRFHGRTGDFLMVHGDCVSIGCYAMTDAGIEEIYALADAALRQGQSFFRVHIFPFRMTTENLKRFSDSSWIEFWQNLREGYEVFESQGRPPNVEVREGRYVFEESKS